MKTYINWSDLNFPWSEIIINDIYLTWEDISIIEEVQRLLRGSSPGDKDAYEEWVKSNPWKKIGEEIGEEKTEKFIKVFCTINNIEYQKGKMIKENIQVSVSQFEKVFNESVRVKIDLKKEYIDYGNK